jgi:type 1 glutamine amidotransferase
VKTPRFLSTALTLLLSLAAPSTLPAAIKVLIIDGQNNHDWVTTTPLLRQILEHTGRFEVDLSTAPAGAPRPPRPPAAPATPAQEGAYAAARAKYAEAAATHQAAAPARWAKWRPKFSDYSVVVSNYNGEQWPEEVRTAFVAYVSGGGGFVSYHAADNPFANWPEYNRMIGVGGWDNRTQKSGPYLRLRDGVWTKDFTTPGPGGSHDSQREFIVETNSPQHPVMAGLPSRWMHTKDECYHSLRGPAENLTVLGSALALKTQEMEPMLMAIDYGRGRVFHTTLGHGVEAVSGLGFQITFARGVEWAATGRVTLPAPSSVELQATRAAVRELKVAARPTTP